MSKLAPCHVNRLRKRNKLLYCVHCSAESRTVPTRQKKIVAEKIVCAVWRHHYLSTCDFQIGYYCINTHFLCGVNNCGCGLSCTWSCLQQLGNRNISTDFDIYTTEQRLEIAGASPCTSKPNLLPLLETSRKWRTIATWVQAIWVSRSTSSRAISRSSLVSGDSIHIKYKGANSVLREWVFDSPPQRWETKCCCISIPPWKSWPRPSPANVMARARYLVQ